MADLEAIITELAQSVPGAILQDMPPQHVVARRELEMEPSFSSQMQGHNHKLLIPRTRLSGVFLVTEAEHLPDLDSILQDDFRKDGVEALAWYRSYHYGTSHKWGISMRREGIYYLAKYLQGEHYKASSYLDIDVLDFIQIAFNYLQLHEYFHFIADIACTVVELSQHNALYRRYFSEVYTQKNDKFEEAIANAYASRMMQRQGVAEPLKQFMLHQPPFYNAYGHWTGRRAFQYGRQKLAGLMCPSLAGTSGVVPGSELLFRIDHADLDYQDVPIYLETSKAATRIIPSLRVVQKIKHLEHTSKFDEEFKYQPQSIKMKVEVAKHKLQEDVQDPSLHFDKIRGHGPVFTVRVDGSYKMSMRHYGGDTWKLLRIGRSSDIHGNPG